MSAPIPVLIWTCGAAGVGQGSPNPNMCQWGADQMDVIPGLDVMLPWARLGLQAERHELTKAYVKNIVSII